MDDGFMFGRFFVALADNELFCGIAIRIGKDYDLKRIAWIYHITMQVGYLQLSVGYLGKGYDK